MEIINNEHVLSKIMSDLNEQCKYLEEFFKYFMIHYMNFSKSLQNEIQLFVPKIKYNENAFTCSQKEQLIFFGDDSPSYNKINLKNDINMKNIDIALSILNRMKLEIQLQHEKLKSKNEANEIAFTKQFNSDMIIFNNTLSSFNKHKSALSISNDLTGETHIENIEPTISRLHELKQEFTTIYEQTALLRKQKKELQAQLNKFHNLPTDINQIRKIVEIKREEHKQLQQKKGLI